MIFKSGITIDYSNFHLETAEWSEALVYVMSNDKSFEIESKSAKRKLDDKIPVIGKKNGCS